MGLIVYKDHAEVVCDMCGQEIKDATLIDADGYALHIDCVKDALRDRRFARTFQQVIEEALETDTAIWKDREE